jgi:hypothetical protein
VEGSVPRRWRTAREAAGYAAPMSAAAPTTAIVAGLYAPRQWRIRERPRPHELTWQPIWRDDDAVRQSGALQSLPAHSTSSVTPLPLVQAAGMRGIANGHQILTERR